LEKGGGGEGGGGGGGGGGGDTGGGHGGEGALECELRTFPREWSPRNMVLYGLR